MIYLDNAATTKPKKEVIEAMMPYLTDYYGNPSAIYQFAGEAKAAIENARESCARLIGGKASAIHFTSGGTESDNWALVQAVRLNPDKKHIIIIRIEHHAILHTAQALRLEGCEVTVLGVDERGRINPKDIEDAIRPDTALISVMTANNEIGTIEPIEEIGRDRKSVV